MIAAVEMPVQRSGPELNLNACLIQLSGCSVGCKLPVGEPDGAMVTKLRILELFGPVQCN